MSENGSGMLHTLFQGLQNNIFIYFIIMIIIYYLLEQLKLMIMINIFC